MAREVARGRLSVSLCEVPRGGPAVARLGFTVVELLVTAAIFVVVLAALGALMVSSTRAYQVNAVRSEALQDSEAVLHLMRYEIGLAGYRGLGASTYDQDFTMGSPETVVVERTIDGDEVTVRFFEDRFVSDSGERSVTFSVDAASQTLQRVEVRPAVGGTTETTTNLLVGNILTMTVVELVGPDRERVTVDAILLDSTAAPEALAGLNFLIEFEGGREWEFMIGLTNPQVYEVLP